MLFGCTRAIALISLILLAGCRTPTAPAPTAEAEVHLEYPRTPTNDVVENYHGISVADPYRWLEDDNAPATRAWVEAQNRVTFGYLDQIQARPVIRDRMAELWNYERYGVPLKRGGRYFFTKNDGLQNQSVLYTTPNLTNPPVVLMDPNRLATDGTVALSGFTLSPDGSKLAYGLANAGSDWQEWHVRDVEGARDLPDIIRWVKFSSASWTADARGFFYSRYDEPAATNLLKGVTDRQKLYFHQLGTPQADDRLIYEKPDHKEWGFAGKVTEDGRFLVIHVSEGTDPHNRVFYLDLQREGAPVVELLNAFDASYRFIDNDGTRFYFRTDRDAPRGRVIAIDLEHPARQDWSELVPEGTDSLETVTRVGRLFFAEYLHHAVSQIRVFDAQGKPRPSVELPGLGSTTGFEGRSEDTETFYSFASFTSPGAVYRYDLTTGRSEIFRQPKLAFDPNDYETKQVFYRSGDGTRIPMFIVHRRGLALDGRRPTLLYGYGGFRISLRPSFSVPQLVWMEMGGVYAVANLRGGGEYGETWHQAGIKLQKQHVFDDFIAAAEWLVLNRYTNSRKLAIAGGSNGGLLVGACMTQRPGLFAAALPAVGVMDMLRFHKFTIGWAWTSDYGCADNAAEFKALHAYSPLHNLHRGTIYPSTLITTGDHDDRVVPAHSFKFAAALQASHAGLNPVLIRIETRAGHGAGKPVAKLIEEAADRWAFLTRELDMQLPEGWNEPPSHAATVQRP